MTAHIATEAQRLAEGLEPYQRAAIYEGNLRPAYTEAQKRLREAERRREDAEYERDHLVINRFMHPASPKEADARERVIADAEAEMERQEREIARCSAIVAHLKDRL